MRECDCVGGRTEVECRVRGRTDGIRRVVTSLRVGRGVPFGGGVGRVLSGHERPVCRRRRQDRILETPETVVRSSSTTSPPGLPVWSIPGHLYSGHCAGCNKSLPHTPSDEHDPSSSWVWSTEPRRTPRRSPWTLGSDDSSGVRRARGGVSTHVGRPE